MFRFVELTLQNWDYFQNIRVPLDGDVVLVTGPNGSGKTTLIDAIRQLVGARRLSSKRHTEHYVRDPARIPLIRAVVSNTAGNGATRPFIRERVIADEVTLACALVTTRSGELERRYAIRPGRTSVPELHEMLIESRGDFYTPEPYQRALQNAGLSRSMLQVIALEQGKTNALFESSPRELFERVMDTRGDREILDRYREARYRYEDNTKELTEQTAALHRKQRDLDAIRREVERLDVWTAARDRVGNLRELLIGTRLQQKLRRRREIGSQIKTLQNREDATQNEIAALEQRLGELRATESAAKIKLDSAAQQEDQGLAVRDSAVEARAAAQADVTQLEKKQAALASLGPSEGVITDMERTAEEAGRARYRAESDQEQLAARIERAKLHLERLRTGLATYPDSVGRMLAELRERSISVGVVADTMEIGTPELAEAAESALGPARYGLVVAQEHEATAISVARKLKFPGPIYAGPLLDRSAVAGPLVLEQGAPSWLKSWPDTIELCENGSWNNIQGVWVTAVEDRVIGKSGRKAALDRTELEFSEAQGGLSASHAALALAVARQGEARAALRREERRHEYSEELRLLPAARQKAETAETAAAQAERNLSDSRGRHAAARALHQSASVELNKVELKHANAETTLATVRTELQARRTEAGDVDGTILELGVTVSPDLRARAERQELGAPDTVEYDLKEATIKFESLGQPPVETVRDEERVMRANVEEADRHVRQRDREAQEARNELEECRTRYLEVVNQTLVDYRRRIRDIAEIAGVASEVEIPKLVNDDRLLDEARIGVRFGFDNKDPLTLGDPSFSGGQQVIAGLILLMAMAETESHGFFMLDEPFAHLSLDRIDHVGRFLRSTRSQFIITAPTTIERAQFDPATIAIVLQKKRAGEAYAPAQLWLGNG